MEWAFPSYLQMAPSVFNGLMMRATKKHHVAHQHHHRSDHSRVSLESNTLSLGHILAKPPPEPRQQAGKQEMSNNSYKVLLWGTWQLVARVAVGGRWCSDTAGQRRDGGGEEKKGGEEGRGLARRSLKKWEYMTKCSHDSCLLFITRTPSGPKKKKKDAHMYTKACARARPHTQTKPAVTAVSNTLGGHMPSCPESDMQT